MVRNSSLWTRVYSEVLFNIQQMNNPNQSHAAVGDPFPFMSGFSEYILKTIKYQRHAVMTSSQVSKHGTTTFIFCEEMNVVACRMVIVPFTQSHSPSHGLTLDSCILSPSSKLGRGWKVGVDQALCCICCTYICFLYYICFYKKHAIFFPPSTINKYELLSAILQPRLFK